MVVYVFRLRAPSRVYRYM